MAFIRFQFVLSIAFFQRNYGNYVASTIEFRMHFCHLKIYGVAMGDRHWLIFRQLLLLCAICLRRVQLSFTYSVHFDDMTLCFFGLKTETSRSNRQFFTLEFSHFFSSKPHFKRIENLRGENTRATIVYKSVYHLSLGSKSRAHWVVGIGAEIKMTVWIFVTFATIRFIFLRCFISCGQQLSKKKRRTKRLNSVNAIRFLAKLNSFT